MKIETIQDVLNFLSAHHGMKLTKGSGLCEVVRDGEPSWICTRDIHDFKLVGKKTIQILRDNGYLVPLSRLEERDAEHLLNPMKIYLLMGHVHHEYDAPMIAFIDQSKAMAKLEELSVHCQDPKTRCLGDYDSYSVKEMGLLP